MIYQFRKAACMHSFMVSIIGAKIISILLITSTCTSVNGQVKWDGEAWDGLWNTALNWVGNTVPSPTADVYLDNSFILGNYIVTLPGGGSAVTVRSLTILPVLGKNIELLLPVANTSIPAFTTIGSVYGLIIHSGGIFRNSSGASAGTPVNISDSIRINNGGLYIHNTSRAHATNVTVLSKLPGTEHGSFEFDVPGGSGYTVSIAGRMYGNMILSANAAGGTKSYTSTGTSSLQINGNFIINAGVNYSLNFNGGFTIHGDFTHTGSVFDISSGAHNNRLVIKKNVNQTGILTESGTGFPVFEFEGIANQDIRITGSITGSTVVRVNNPAGITLRAPMVVSNKIELLNGNIKTTSANILVFQDNASYSGAAVNSFVEGPVKKIGDDDFIFPVGKQADYAPLSIAGIGGSITDEFQTEYFLGDPAIVFGTAIENPITHVSRLEYWKLDRNVGASSKKVTLSVRTYSDATLLEKLVIGRWEMTADIWRNEGNTAYSGIASGTVTSSNVHSFGTFTLASTVASENPLPIQATILNVKNNDGYTTLSWMAESSQYSDFDILRSNNNIHFIPVGKVNSIPNKLHYHFSEKLTMHGVYYYQLRIKESTGNVRLSNVVSVSHQPGFRMETYSAVIRNNILTITFNNTQHDMVSLFILNAMGEIVRKFGMIKQQFSGPVVIDMAGLPPGVYYVTATSSRKKTTVLRIVKL